jgi:hypothetical protein
MAKKEDTSTLDYLRAVRAAVADLSKFYEFKWSGNKRLEELAEHEWLLRNDALKALADLEKLWAKNRRPG